MGNKLESGVVRNLRRGDESGALLSGIKSNEARVHVVSFRLELTDPGGDITGYHQIEMRGYKIVGDVTEGDRVEVDVTKSRNGILSTRSIRNLTTDSLMTVPGPTFLEQTRRIGFVVWVVVFAIFFIAVAMFILTIGSKIFSMAGGLLR